MAKKTSERARRKSSLKSLPRTASPKPVRSTIPSVSAQLPAPTAKQIQEAQKKFEEGIVSRGEAAPSGKPLPPRATHEIVGHKADKTPILKRKRFSMR